VSAYLSHAFGVFLLFVAAGAAITVCAAVLKLLIFLFAILFPKRK
jgi:hypothetical protein